MTQHPWRERVGSLVRPVLESTALDRVKGVGLVRRFARDWAVAFGFWDDGLLAADVHHAPMDVAQAAAWTKRRAQQAQLTVYFDHTDAASERMRQLLDSLGARARFVD